MGRRPVEVRFAYQQDDGDVLVQTGIYVFEDTTLADLRRLAERSKEVPDFIELHLDQFKESGEDDEDGE